MGATADIFAGRDDLGSRGCPYGSVNCAGLLLGRLQRWKRVNRAIAASSAVTATAAAMPSTTEASTVSADPSTVSAEAGMAKAGMAKAAMAMVAMKPVAMIPAMAAPAAAPTLIVKIERAVDWIGVRVIWSAIIRLHRASGEKKSDADQEGRRLRYHSAALHRSLHSYEFIESPLSRAAI
jgi:hypothetical protein